LAKNNLKEAKKQLSELSGKYGNDHDLVNKAKKQFKETLAFNKLLETKYIPQISKIKSLSKLNKIEKTLLKYVEKRGIEISPAALKTAQNIIMKKRKTIKLSVNNNKVKKTVKVSENLSQTIINRKKEKK
jgi:hypothetical protein